MSKADGERFSLPLPSRGEQAFVRDANARLGSHIKSAEQALLAVKTEALRSFGLTVAQYAVLLSLYYIPGQSSAQLARIAAVTPQTMGGVIEKLEARGLVVRERSLTHRKVLMINLTPAGEKLVLRADAVPRRIEEELGASFSPAERDALCGLLDRVVAILNRQLTRPT